MTTISSSAPAPMRALSRGGVGHQARAALSRAGADVIFVEGPKTIEEAEAIAREIDIPLLYNITPTGSVPPLDVATLERIGFRLLSCSVYMMLAALPSMQNFLRVLKTTGDVAKAAAPRR